jgi:LytS/YehU family sensor histidine kinase
MAALAPPVIGYGADKALKAIQNKAAKNAMSQIASGQIPRPRSNQAWQALVQAEAEALRSQAEQQYQESQIAP